MSKSTSFICGQCGRHIDGVRYTYNGKSFCCSCFQGLQSDLEHGENEKKELYDFIKNLYGVQEVPADVLVAIDQEISRGKKIPGIIKTLRYYFEIEGHQLGTLSAMVFVVRDYYQTAKKYYTDMQKLRQLNDQVDLQNIPSVTVKINTAQLGAKRSEFSYRMEDL